MYRCYNKSLRLFTRVYHAQMIHLGLKALNVFRYFCCLEKSENFINAIFGELILLENFLVQIHSRKLYKIKSWLTQSCFVQFIVGC